MTIDKRKIIGALAALTAGLVLPTLGAREALAQPGCSATVYWDANFGGEARTLHGDVPFVGRHWNDQISSIIVHEGHWVFFYDAGFQGEALELGPGPYAYVGDHWNDQISSARCIAPTY